MKLCAIVVTVIVCCSTAASDTFYVSTNSPVDGPGTDWSNAFHTIQDAVDAAVTPGDVVLVTNGTYRAGGAVTPGYISTNRVCITSAITVQSVNGASETIINGTDSVRCVFLGTDAVFSGFTLTNGSVLVGDDVYYDLSGGGVLLTDGMITDCVLTGNRAEYGGGVELYGGGTISNCTLSGNSAKYDGGGASLDDEGGTITHSTLSGNTAKYDGGGAALYGGVLNNCILRGNAAESSGGGSELYGGLMNNCILSGNAATNNGGGVELWEGGQLNNCTLSMNVSEAEGGGAYLFDGGVLNNCILWNNESAVSGHDIFDDGADAIRYSCSSDGVLHGTDGCITNAPMFVSSENYRLGYGSPCIDAGTNAYAAGSTDLDGTARIVNTTVDMGAYEYDAGLYDTDGDTVTDGDELVADTDPVDAEDYFHITGIDFYPPVMWFPSSDTRLYTLQMSTNLVEGSWDNIPSQTGITGNGTELILTDSAATNSSCFYRVIVEL